MAQLKRSIGGGGWLGAEVALGEPKFFPPPRIEGEDSETQPQEFPRLRIVLFRQPRSEQRVLKDRLKQLLVQHTLGFTNQDASRGY